MHDKKLSLPFLISFGVADNQLQLTNWQGWNNRDETVWKNVNSPFDDVFAEPSQNDKMLTKDEVNLGQLPKQIEIEGGHLNC